MAGPSRTGTSWSPQASLRSQRFRARNVARIALRSTRAAGRAAAGARDLPDFVIIGAQRSGTTSLYRDLVSHPQVLAPLGKELQFFTVYHRFGLRWYAGHFPAKAEGEQTFEASPYYLYHPHAVDRAAAALPAARFVVMLRDPVERAWSHYRHTRATGVEPLEFLEALHAEPARLRRADDLGVDSARGHRILRQFSYADRGRYGQQLSRWVDAVGRDRVHVIRAESYHADPATHYARLLSFLDLEEHSPGYFANVNAGVAAGVTGSASPAGAASESVPGSRVPPAAAAFLRAELRADAEVLRTVTGWDDPWG